mmetsp:Transcript_19044/g.62060  ORF Transcript_19044/g.62060 Transcript_19044/m.62060 type:complete len:687 (+) Transcript_19044:75-2135(+)
MSSALLLLLLPSVLLLSLPPAAVHAAEEVAEAEERVDEAAESSECWTYGGGDQFGLGPELCCGPAPCGQKNCWAPPEFQYFFCCEEPACRPAVITGVQRALAEAAALGPALATRNASAVARGAAAEELQTLRRRLRGLRLDRSNGGQDCNCAVAYAAALLLASGGADDALANRAIRPSWLAEGISWHTIVADGWGALFAWLARPPVSGSHPNCAASSDIAPRPSAAPRSLEHSESLSLEALVDLAQERARKVAAEVGDGECALSTLVSSLRADGTFAELWGRIAADEAARRLGRKCVAVEDATGHAAWTSCSTWSYSIDADFSSPKAGVGTRQGAVAAVCVVGAPRNVLDTFRSIRDNVLKVLHGDAFVYVPFGGSLTPHLERQLSRLGPIATAIAVPDVDQQGFEQRFLGELHDPRLAALYSQAPGPWRAPVFGQMGSSMWGYFHQDVCQRMVKAYEEQRGNLRYDWVVFARADMMWTHRHPPIYLLNPGFVHVPFGQDNSYYNHGPEHGLNDRHAIVPRHLVDGYFGRIQALRTGEAWGWYVERMATAGDLINTEQYLLIHLRACEVPIRRFPPVAFIVQCTEGPQCQHLYKGTNLGKQQWTQTAKYWTELIEVTRTTHDDFHGVHRPRHGWIWERERPYAALDPKVSNPWELHSLDFVCCTSRSGPVTCSRLWTFMKRCQCVT